MKTILTRCHSSAIRSLIVSVIVLFGVAQTRAQRYIRLPKFHIGLEVSSGPRSVQVKSDIEALNNVRVDEEGINVGMVLGTNAVQAKIRKGFFTASKASAQKIDFNGLDISLNGMLLSFFGTKIKYVKPYFSLGFARNNLSFTGSYSLPENQTVPAETVPPCCCKPPSDGPLGDPDFPGVNGAPTAETPIKEEEVTKPEDKELGSMMQSRLNAGLGVQIFVPTNRYFISLFADVKYGILVSSSTATPAFENTRISAPVYATLGVAFGLGSR